MAPATCTLCHFDPAAWTVTDAVRTLHPLGPWWRETVGGCAAPAPGEVVALAAEAGDRFRAGARTLLAALGDPDGSPAPEPGPAGPVPADPALAAAIDALEADALALVGLASGLPAERWDGEPGARLRDLVHIATHDVRQAGRLVHAAGAGAPPATGRVAQLSVSDGGVPKRPVDEVRIGLRGLEGDRQAARQHHGRPWQALCLWSVEVIDRLRAEGHPIGPGLAGENVTIAGLDWSSLRPGTRLRIGQAEAELSLFALPCAKNAQWFADRDFNRMLHTREPGVSRLYAWVVEEGTVRVGDPVVVNPSGTRPTDDRLGPL